MAICQAFLEEQNGRWKVGCHIGTFTAFEMAFDLGGKKSKRSAHFNRNRSNFRILSPPNQMPKFQAIGSSRPQHWDFQCEKSTGFNRNHIFHYGMTPQQNLKSRILTLYFYRSPGAHKGIYWFQSKWPDLKCWKTWPWDLLDFPKWFFEFDFIIELAHWMIWASGFQ